MDGWEADEVESQADGQTNREPGNKGERSWSALGSRRIRIFILKKPTLDYNWELVSAKKWVYDVIISPSVEVSSWVRERERWQDD